MKSLVFALVASLAVNAYLLLVRTTTNPSQPEEPAQKPDRPAAIRAPEMPSLVPSHSSPSSYGLLERAVLEQRIVATEAEIEEHLRPNERFAKNEPRSLANEARIKPFLDKVFGAGSEPTYLVECRGQVCKIDPKVKGSAWMQSLQRDHEGLFSGVMFSARDVFVEIAREGQHLALRIQMIAHADFRVCLEAHNPRGELTSQLVMDGPNRVVLRLSGPLAQQPFGVCVANAYERAIAQVPVPPGVHVEDREQTTTLPLD